LPDSTLVRNITVCETLNFRGRFGVIQNFPAGEILLDADIYYCRELVFLCETLSGKRPKHRTMIMDSRTKDSPNSREVVGSGECHTEASSAQALSPGASAPDFCLHVTPDQTVSLKDFAGKILIIAFYPADWSPVCGDQMALYNEVLPEFHRHNAELVGISVDGVWCHLAFAKDRKLHFPLLADFEPKGAVAKAYHVYRDQDGICERALFVIDEQGKIIWTHVSPIGVNPGADGILNALEENDNKGEAAA
jgi:peroxiredoxin